MANSFLSWVRLEPLFVKASLVLEVRKLGSSKPMAFADFLGLWGFLAFGNSLTFWRLFDQFTTTTTIVNPIILNHNLGHAS